MALAKEQIRQIISQNDISSVADVYSLMKESFNHPVFIIKGQNHYFLILLAIFTII